MKKNTFIDYLKGIAILLVLVGHCIQYGSGASFLDNGDYWNNIVMKIIYSFHMPFFIAISGYLFYYSVKNHGMFNGIKSRFIRLMPVCFTWAIILSFVDFVNGEFTGINLLIYHFLTDFWFLWAIIFSIMCTVLIEILDDKFMGGGYTILIVIIFISLFIITPDILWAHAYKYVAPYFIAGYFYAKNNKNWLNSNVVGNISLILWIILMQFYSKDSYIYTTGITIFRKENIYNQINIDVYRYLIGALGTVSIIWILKKLYTIMMSHESLWVIMSRRIVEYMGRNSIVYYILSTYLFTWIMPLFTKNVTYNFALNLIETVIVALLCELIGKFIENFCVISKWIIAK